MQATLVLSGFRTKLFSGTARKLRRLADKVANFALRAIIVIIKQLIIGIFTTLVLIMLLLEALVNLTPPQ